jgi:tRNA dimethylallyltransferase
MLLGPTASGKSAAAMQLAQRESIEIISVDSAQVYRDMDIGTAKPTSDERTRVPHHLIDLIDPASAYSAAQFVSDAETLMNEIRGRNRQPVLVGGTMLYVKALCDGLNTLPPANPGIREKLDAQAASIGWPAMHQRLAQLDPGTAARLEPNDAQRIQRALEVIELSGQPMSELLAQPINRNENANNYVKISLEPDDRSILHARIAQRFNTMIEQGLIEEVRGLHARDDLHEGLPSVRCVGYRQIWQWLASGEAAATRHDAIEAGIAATRQLAKRQLTWLRGSDRHIINSNNPNAPDEAAALAREIINAN